LAALLILQLEYSKSLAEDLDEELRRFDEKVSRRATLRDGQPFRSEHWKAF